MISLFDKKYNEIIEKFTELDNKLDKILGEINSNHLEKDEDRGKSIVPIKQYEHYDGVVLKYKYNGKEYSYTFDKPSDIVHLGVPHGTVYKYTNGHVIDLRNLTKYGSDTRKALAELSNKGIPYSPDNGYVLKMLDGNRTIKITHRFKTLSGILKETGLSHNTVDKFRDINNHSVNIDLKIVRKSTKEKILKYLQTVDHTEEDLENKPVLNFK